MNAALDKVVFQLAMASLPALQGNLDAYSRLLIRPQLIIDHLSRVAERDPGITLRLLRTINSLQRQRLRTEITTLTHAQMMLGIDTLKGIPRGMKRAEDLEPPLRARLFRSYMLACHRAEFARDFARLRRDLDANEIYVVALLYDLGKMLLDQQMPAEMAKVREIRASRGMEPAEAQYVSLGFTLDELTVALARQWKLPQLLIDTLHGEAAQNGRSLGIIYAHRLIRAVDRHGWYGPPTHDLMEQIADYLLIDAGSAARHIHQTAAHIAGETTIFRLRPLAVALLLPPPAEERQKSREMIETSGPSAPFCLAPQPQIIRPIIHDLQRTLEQGKLTLQQLFESILHAMHEGLGLNRCVFALLTHERDRLRGRCIVSSDDDPHFNRFEIALDQTNIFSRLMDKPQSFWLHAGNRQRFAPLIPVAVQRLIQVDGFVAMSIFVHHRPLGLIYADRKARNVQIDAGTYKRFKQLATQASHTLHILLKR
jgi:HD-like signal output (HDOD) protein